MKVVFGSDIHGSAEAGRKLIEAFRRESADQLILCGDVYYHGPRNPLPEGHSPMDLAGILNENKAHIRCVKGNCDCEVDEMISEFKFEPHIHAELAGKQVFVTHGHVYDKNNPPPVPFDIMVYGHYHVCFIERKNGKIYASPGSVALPKNQTPPAYLILTSSNLTLKTLEGKTLGSLDL